MSHYEDDTVVDAPDQTRTFAPGGVVGAVTHAMYGDDAAELVKHRRTIRKTAEDDAIARMFQQRAIAVMLIALAPIVPGAILLITWGLYTGDMFR